MKITIKESCTLLEALLLEYKNSNKTRVRQSIKFGKIRVNGVVMTNASYLLKAGDIVDQNLNKSTRSNAPKAPFTIKYEDDFLIVVVKPAGILTSGTTTEKKKSMYRMVDEYLKIAYNTSAYLVHRLDREVSGLLIFAKNLKTQQVLKDNWKSVSKIYIALCEGFPEKESGEVHSWLKDGEDQKVYSVQKPDETAKEAITRYKVIQRFPFGSLFEIELITGRKNQIRVHLSDIGCPIIGDRKYGADDRFHRQIRLFAKQISFQHPKTNERITIEANVPANFLKPGDFDENY